MSGRPMSRNTTSSGRVCATCSASAPVWAMCAAWPSMSSSTPRLSAASVLSSTTSTCSWPGLAGSSVREAPRPRRSPPPAAAAGRRRCCPRPCRDWSRTRCRHAATPGSGPATGRCPGRPAACRRWTCANISNTLSMASAAMPTPVSVMQSTASWPSTRTFSAMRPPGGVYLAALFRRLLSTCAIRVGSASIGSGSEGTSTLSLWPPASISTTRWSPRPWPRFP